MILSCNSCEKKFVVPDNAITAAGRTVQCGSCGNKWKQFPLKNNISIKSPERKKDNKKIEVSRLKSLKAKKVKVKKNREYSLYSPEYLSKKHGITLGGKVPEKKINHNKKVSFGFYNSLLLFTIIVIALSRSLYFFQDFIITTFPYTEVYLSYFFENIRNIFEIWKNLILSY